MLSTIFLLKGKDIYNLNHLDIYSYPEDIVKTNGKNFIDDILLNHDQKRIKRVQNRKKKISQKSKKSDHNTGHFVIGNPVSQKLNNKNIYTSSINSEMIIGLVFDQEDNPLDYRDVFEDLSNELLNNENCCSFEDELEIENLLITLFIDLRRYGDEILEQYLEVSSQPSGIFIKIFLFGIDDVGKTSLVRRIKTNNFDDNYFAPTKKFEIEYIQKEQGVLAFWDIPGQISLREKWLKGIQDSNILVYMIDIANQLRFKESKLEFWRIIDNEVTANLPILILGNKLDLIDQSRKNNQEQAKRMKKEIIDQFEFNKLDNHLWKFLLTSVKTNYNIEKLLNLIFDLIS